MRRPAPPPRPQTPPRASHARTRSITGSVDETAGAIKSRLWAGGLGRGLPMSTGARKKISDASQIVLIYAGQQMADGVALGEYHVPPGCKCMIAIDAALLKSGKPDADSAYWN